MKNDETDSTNASDKRRLDDISQDFLRAWQNGKNPDLRSFFEEIEFDNKASLLKTLLPIEIANRIEKDNTVDPEDYRWAGDSTADFAASIIAEIGARNQTRSLNDPLETTGFAAGFELVGGSSPKAESNSHTNSFSIEELGDYRIIRELGRGGMGAVFEAVHKTLGHPVALKLLPRVEGLLLHRFKREFRSLTETNHPNLVGLHNLESDGEHWFFTMDLVRDATDFRRYVRPNNQLDELRLRHALNQLVAGVSTLHKLQIIHRDLKPANVMVGGDGNLVILDFGLVAELERRNATVSERNIAGTPAYMSPEQALGNLPSPASDWYAVGVMLFEALSGQRPFDGGTMKVLSDKTREDAPKVNCDEPADLCRLCMQLLAKEPERRPTTADILQAVIVDENAKQSATVTGTLATRLIGREQQFADLESAFREFEADQQAVSVFVSGRSGEGKTILTEQFLSPLARDERYALIHGRCYDRESVPFKALDSLIDGLCSYLRRLDERDAALLMPREIGLLARLFPVLNRVNVVASVPTPRLGQLDEQQIRTRAFQALRELLTRISDAKPVIAFVDDLQWGDAESAEAMFEILRPPNAPLLFFVGTYRSDEAKDSEFLAYWDERISRDQTGLNQRNIQVHPFSESQCVDLILKILDADTPAIREKAVELAKQTGGNPFLISELVERFDLSSNSNEPLAMAQLIGDKLSGLDGRAAQMLNVIAVSGQALPLLELAKAIGNDTVDISTLTAMRNQRLVRLLGQDDDQKIDTYHDRIRETILENIAKPIEIKCHLDLAKAIEESCGSEMALSVPKAVSNTPDEREPITGMARVYDLAYHYDAGGEKQLALTYSLLAAEQAERQFSPQVASEQYARAGRNADQADNDLRHRIHLGSGRTLRLTGQYNEALESLDQAFELASQRFDRAQITGLKAEITHKQGKMSDSLRLYSEALRQLRVYVPKTRVGYFFALLYQIVVQVAHTWLPAKLYRRSREATPEESLTMELANRNSIVSYFNDGIRMMWTHLKGMNLAETRQPSPALAYAYGLHPAPLMALRLATRGKRYSDQGLEMAEGYGDQLMLAHCHSMIGLAQSSNGEFKAGIQSSEIARERIRKTGDYYLLMQTEFALASCSLRVGHTGGISACIAGGFNRELNFGASNLAGPYLYLASLVTHGKLPIEDKLNKIASDDSDHLGQIFVKLAKGISQLQDDKFEVAFNEFNSAWILVLRRLVIWAPTFSCLNWSITALRKWAESCDASKSKQRKKLIARAIWRLRVSNLLSWIYIGERAHMLRESGLILEQKRKPGKALKKLRQSLAIAENLDDQWNRALTLREIGRIENNQGVPGSDKMIDQADVFLESVHQDVACLNGRMES